MVMWVPVVDPHDHVAAWELWLQQLPSITRVDLPHVPSQEKVKIPNLKYAFYQMQSRQVDRCK